MDSKTLLDQLTAYDSSRRSSNDVLNDAMKQYGIPEIRGRVSGLRTTLSNTENALNAVDPSVTGRTSGSLVTEAQRSRQVANEREPIAEQYGQQSRALGNESANLSESLSAAKMIAEGSINDWNAGRTALQSRYDIQTAREAEARRQAEADRDFQMRQQQAAREAAAAKGYSLGGKGSTPTAPKTDFIQQQAFDDAFTRLKSQPDADVASDIRATRISAGRGNKKDEAKLAVYYKYRPDLFNHPNAQPPGVRATAGGGGGGGRGW